MAILHSFEVPLTTAAVQIEFHRAGRTRHVPAQNQLGIWSVFKIKPFISCVDYKNYYHDENLKKTHSQKQQQQMFFHPITTCGNAARVMEQTRGTRTILGTLG